MIVIIRLDLDVYDLNGIERLVSSGLITIGDATEAKEVKKMSEFEILMWVRELKRDMKRAS